MSSTEFKEPNPNWKQDKPDDDLSDKKHKIDEEEDAYEEDLGEEIEELQELDVKKKQEVAKPKLNLKARDQKVLKIILIYDLTISFI